MSDDRTAQREAILHAMGSRLNALAGMGEPAWVAVVTGECLLGLDQHGYVVIPDQPDHYVTFDDDGWFVEHSIACRIAGTLGTCDYNAAIRKMADGMNGPDPDRMGRWRIRMDAGYGPDLERVEKT